ncbi:hypothetical protein K469DRAFT_677185 [Zopfia rhizophila CBS 207.26]|uniref:MARVEL domain-containing protein n=1 Tax=Zopfia rhizophila CBS 207.26 TaxID=1314779 RepID=A0A6A6DDA9_9PEZI|nr:hypothetical protein K469DRAFT_677185 [Zopfia rhizophila CBS 207.26]
MEANSPQTSQNFRQTLDDGESHWLWKLSLRAALLVLGIIGVGCMGWAVQTSTSNYYGYLDDRWMACWSLITFGCSIIWCAICILVLLLRRPPRPVHPGVAVGMDLVLWLAFIPTMLFAVLACISVLEFGRGGVIDQYDAYGYYWQAPNGTWVYNQTEYAIEYQRNRSCDNPSSNSYYGYGSHEFKTCAEVDAYVNRFWKSLDRRAGVEITGTVCQGLALILHFALFVWACVDTHKRNSQKTSKEAEKLAASIVMNMVRNGAVVPALGQQPMPHPMSHPMPHPMQHPQQHSMASPVGPGQVLQSQIVEHYGNEKRQSARFA